MANPESRLRFELQPYYGGEPFVLEIEPGNLGIQLMDTNGQFAGNPAGDGVYIKRMNENKKFYRALMEINDRSEDNMLFQGPNTMFKIVSLEIPGKDGNKTAILNALRTLARMQPPGGTSADFVASPPAATDGWLQNVAAALGLSAVVGGSMITDSGYAGGMPMVGDVDLGGLGATQPEYGSMNPDFVVGDGESVIPSFRVAQTMAGDGQSAGLDPETIGYLTDGSGNFMIRTHFEGDRSMMAEDKMIDQDTEIMTMVGAAINAVIEGLENHAKTKQRGMNDKERIARSAAAAVAAAVNKHQGRGIDLTNDEVLQMAIDNYNSWWSFGGPKIPVIRYGAQTLPSAREYDI